MKVSVSAPHGEVIVELDSNTADLAHVLAESGLVSPEGASQEAYHLAVRLALSETYRLMYAFARLLVEPNNGQAAGDLTTIVHEIRTRHPDKARQEAS